MDGMNRNNMGNYIPQEIPVPEVREDRNQRQQNPYGGRKKSPAAGIIIGIVCAFATILAVGIGVMAYYRSMPAYKISKGFYNLGREIEQIQNPLLEKLGLAELLVMMQEEGSHVETKLNFSAELPMIGKTTLGVDTDYKKDVKAKELNASTVFSLMNYEFAHMDIYANQEVFCFSLPELFLEDIYVDNENVVSQYNESILADVAGESTLEDFSIELFPDQKEKISAREWRNLSAMLERFEEDLESCRDGMTIEKVEKGLYRVILPGKETNRLVKNLLDSYGTVYDAVEGGQNWNDYKNLLASDISILFEIDNKNRIESMILEEPVKVMDGEFSLSGEIFLLGEQRSIEKIQGKLIVENNDLERAEIVCQIVQTTGEEKYRMDLDLKYTEGDDHGKMKYMLDCDAAQDEIEMSFSMKDKKDDLGMNLKGTVEDYEKGRSVEFDLDRVEFTMDGSEIYSVAGELEVEPLQGRIEPTAKAETGLFKMDMGDWQKIILQLDDAYGRILEYLW
ncbi:MAG: hypothetical protein HFI57_11080 [Lachnospiraceae bacterium]|nr:hypothetical protein [Lachnospiraceae bacterium]